MSDPFSVHPRAGQPAEQVPGQQAFPETPVYETEPQLVPEPAGSDLAGAPEVGIQSAGTAPGSRQRRSERDKAAQALDAAVRKVKSVNERLEKARADVARLEAEANSAAARAEYLSQHPALQD